MKKRDEGKKEHRTKSVKPLYKKRILVCGKGGSGKSSIVTLMADAMHENGREVVAFEGDASNLGGLARLLFGLEKGPMPFIEFFRGWKKWNVKHL